MKTIRYEERHAGITAEGVGLFWFRRVEVFETGVEVTFFDFDQSIDKRVNALACRDDVRNILAESWR